MTGDLRDMSGRHRTAAGKPGTAAALLRAHDMRTASHGRWAFILVAALCAFLWQSFVTQTHVHWAPGVDASAPAIAPRIATAASLKAPSSDEPADCPICNEIAHADHLYLPGSVSFPVPEGGDAWIARAASGLSAPGQSSHAWNSRAPPRILRD